MVRVTKLELHRTISDIMKKADLDHLTTKKIRLLCEQKYGIDLTSRKEEIDRIVMAFVNKHCENQDPKKSNKSDSEDESESEESSGSSESSESESGSESENSEPEFKRPKTPEPKKPVNKVVKSPPKPAPVPKKAAVKRSNSDVKKTTTQPNAKSSSANVQKRPKKENDMQKKAEIDDAEFARKLQGEEFGFRRRTVNNLFRDIPSKKTSADEPAKKKKQPSAFLRKCLLSPALAEVLGTDEMSRPDIVQKMWSIVRERNLFDPSNRQFAFLDEQLQEVFGTKRVRLMAMMKYLKKHIKDIR